MLTKRYKIYPEIFYTSIDQIFIIFDHWSLNVITFSETFIFKFPLLLIILNYWTSFISRLNAQRRTGILTSYIWSENLNVRSQIYICWTFFNVKITSAKSFENYYKREIIEVFSSLTILQTDFLIKFSTLKIFLVPKEKP